MYLCRWFLFSSYYAEMQLQVNSVYLVVREHDDTLDGGAVLPAEQVNLESGSSAEVDLESGSSAEGLSSSAAAAAPSDRVESADAASPSTASAEASCAWNFLVHRREGTEGRRPDAEAEARRARLWRSTCFSDGTAPRMP